MKKFLAPFASLIAALLLAAGAAALSPAIFGSAAGEYSAIFPSPPQEDVQTGSNFRIVTHALRQGDVVYIVAHGDFEAALRPEIELDANIDNFVKEFGASVTSRGPLAFARGDHALPAKQFAYDGARARGKGIVVVDGKTSYLAAATAAKPRDHDVAVSAFVNSFKLIAPQ